VWVSPKKRKRTFAVLVLISPTTIKYSLFRIEGQQLPEGSRPHHPSGIQKKQRLGRMTNESISTYSSAAWVFAPRGPQSTVGIENPWWKAYMSHGRPMPAGRSSRFVLATASGSRFITRRRGGSPIDCPESTAAGPASKVTEDRECSTSSRILDYPDVSVHPWFESGEASPIPGLNSPDLCARWLCPPGMRRRVQYGANARPRARDRRSRNQFRLRTK
jgi:hypothetical protein